MNDNTKLLESLLEKASDYGKTSFELLKLKTVDKTADIVSSFVPQSIVVILILVFVIFLNLGIALYLGDLFGKAYLGFFAVASFYILAGTVIHFFLQTRIKRMVADYFIKQVLK
jgi:phosphoglycerol transferase MdoB-like AlkP superfamily enzyme